MNASDFFCNFTMTLRRTHNTESGLTLTELIIAAVLVAIIFTGALSVEYAVRSSRGLVSKDAQLAMSTSATMLQITRDAELAVGDQSSPGMVNTSDGFCFRQDRNATRTPDNYADDSWACYSVEQEKIHRCIVATATPCSVTDAVVGKAVYSVGGGSQLVHQIVLNNPNGIYFDVSITNRSDPLAAADPMDNPTITLQSRISPAGHSF